MQCLQCQHENAPDARFCNQCGRALAPKCTSCGYENASDAKFCNQCGTALTAAPLSAIVADKLTRPELPTPEAERRQLTVMFCDLADSTKLSGQLDPEDLRDVIRAYQSTSAEVIERYDGYIAQHLGDGLMVYFGWPRAHEDDAQRAVHAGLGILGAMGGLNERLEQEKGIRLAVRIGIHTGLVVVGEIGKGASQEHLALGKTPNIASRIEGIALPDTVAISDVTYQLVQGYFVCNDLGQYALKGVDDVPQVYRVVRESDVQSRFDVAAARGLTPLVGRESECALLFERWQQVKDGQGRVVLLSGEAGIGKSRLLQVLRDHVSNEPHLRLECRSSPYYQNTALYPITDMFHRLLKWSQNDTPEVKLDKLEQTLRVYRLGLDETMPLFANLLSLPIPEHRYPPLNIPPQRQRQKTLETIVAMLLQQAKAQTVLFILEDLHWTDPSTLALIDLLIDQARNSRLLCLFTCRPPFHPTWSQHACSLQIPLNRLSRNEIACMAERVAGGKRLPAEVLHQIAEKTDGVPLFVEEMTKDILESGYLTKADDGYGLTGSLPALAIPVSLQDTLMARLDRLVTAKGIAQSSAVLGRTFTYDLLRAVSSVDEEALQHGLHQLVEAELLYQQGQLPQATYMFKNALVQDAAYASLLRRTRQQYHQHIAQVLEAQFPEMAETQPELLAHHYTQAELNDQAIPFLQQAGERANRGSAYQEAIHHFSKGLELLDTLPHTVERLRQELLLQAALGQALLATKGYASPEAERVYVRTRELCQHVQEAPHLPQILLGLAQWSFIRAELKTAQEIGEELFRLSRHHQDPVLKLWSHCLLGLALFYTGAVVQAQTQFEQGMRLYDLRPHHTQALVYGSVDPSVVCPAFAAFCLWLRGYPEQALEKSDRALILAQELAHPLSLARALVWCARLSQFCRQPQATQERAEAAMRIMTEHKMAWLGGATILKEWALSEQGPGEAATMRLRQGLESWRSAGSLLWLPYSQTLLLAAYQNAAQAAEGLRKVTDAFSLIDQTGERWYEAEIHRLQGELLGLQSLDHHREAETCFHQALDLARRQQVKSLELRTATSLARLWQQQGKRQEARDLLASVYNWFTEGFDTADLKDAKALLNELR